MTRLDRARDAASRSTALPRFLTAAALAFTATILTACGRDVIAPEAAANVRAPMAAGQSPGLTRLPSSWIGRPLLIQNIGTTDCLDVPSGNAVSNQWVQQYPCHGGLSQQFILKAVPHDANAPAIDLESVVIVPVLNSALCLDIVNGSTAVGAKLQLYNCHFGQDQRFLFETTQDVFGSLVIRTGSSFWEWGLGNSNASNWVQQLVIDNWLNSFNTKWVVRIL